MPRFSANLGFLFADRPYPERVRAAARAGFPAVEMHWPYDVPPAEIVEALRQTGVAMLGLNTPRGNVGAGEFGLGAVPGREQEFHAGIEMCLDYAKAIGATALHCMAGTLVGEAEAAEETFIANLRLAADRAAAANVMLLVEPINHRDIPNYFLNRIEQAASILERVARTNVRIMFDCYHTQVTQGDLTRRLLDHWPLVGHVQIAAAPSRAEPDEGEIAYGAVFAALDRLGYGGWIGCEYRPRGGTDEGLRWTGSLGVSL